MSGVDIRPATDADAADIARIYNHYIENTVVTFEEMPVSASEMSARMADVWSQSLPWLVAVQANQVTGFAYASRWKVRSAYRHSVESTIYLAPGHERRGVGKALYVALLSPLKARGIHAVIGGAAMPNEASIALHEKLGFQYVGTFRQVGFKHGRWVDVAYWERLL